MTSPSKRERLFIYGDYKKYIDYILGRKVFAVACEISDYKVDGVDLIEQKGSKAEGIILRMQDRDNEVLKTYFRMGEGLFKKIQAKIGDESVSVIIKANPETKIVRYLFRDNGTYAAFPYFILTTKEKKHIESFDWSDDKVDMKLKQWVFRLRERFVGVEYVPDTTFGWISPFTMSEYRFFKERNVSKESNSLNLKQDIHGIPRDFFSTMNDRRRADSVYVDEWPSINQSVHEDINRPVGENRALMRQDIDLAFQAAMSQQNSRGQEMRTRTNINDIECPF